MNLDTLEALAKAVPEDICFQNIHHLKAFKAAANPETILALIALVREMANLLPQDTNGSFIGMGKYYSEHMHKFAPPSDSMSKFKVKWFMDCAQALVKYKEMTK
jgi:hypothetical protein